MEKVTSPLICPYGAALARSSYLPKAHHTHRPYAVSFEPRRLFPKGSRPRHRYMPGGPLFRNAEALLSKALEPNPWDVWWFENCPKDSNCAREAQGVNFRPPFEDELLLWSHCEVRTVVVVDVGNGQHLREGFRDRFDPVLLTRETSALATSLMYAERSKAIAARRHARHHWWAREGSYIAFARILKLWRVWVPAYSSTPKNERPESVNFPAENKNTLLKDHNNERTSIF